MFSRTDIYVRDPNTLPACTDATPSNALRVGGKIGGRIHRNMLEIERSSSKSLTGIDQHIPNINSAPGVGGDAGTFDDQLQGIDSDFSKRSVAGLGGSRRGLWRASSMSAPTSGSIDWPSHSKFGFGSDSETTLVRGLSGRNLENLTKRLTAVEARVGGMESAVMDRLDRLERTLVASIRQGNCSGTHGVGVEEARKEMRAGAAERGGSISGGGESGRVLPAMCPGDGIEITSPPHSQVIADMEEELDVEAGSKEEIPPVVGGVYRV